MFGRNHEVSRERTRGGVIALAACLVALVQCGPASSTGGASPSPIDAGPWDGSHAGIDAGLDDPDPTFTPQERAQLRTLRYDPAGPPVDPSNRLADDASARSFGQRLFFERALSGALLEGDNDGSTSTLGIMGEPGKVSCAGCHLPAAGFVDARSPHGQISLAAQWTRRRTPTLLEVAFAPLYNWDGRRDAIWNQAIGVMESDREFNSGRLFVAEQIFRLHRTEYEALFGTMPPLDDGARFPQLTPKTAGCQLVNGLAGACRGKPGDGADYDGMLPGDQDAVTTVIVNVTKAIAAYVRQLRCGAGAFDRWLDGEAAALDRAAQRGAALFVGRGLCASCHSGPRLTDDLFHNVGLIPGTVAVAFTDTNDRGAIEGIGLAMTDPLNSRGRFSDGDRGKLPTTLDSKLEGAFRTPTVRCTASRPSFMHTGQLRTLDHVVAFFSRGGDPPGGYPGLSEAKPLDLTAREQKDLVAFLRSLEGPGPPDGLRRAP